MEVELEETQTTETEKPEVETEAEDKRTYEKRKITEQIFLMKMNVKLN